MSRSGAEPGYPLSAAQRAEMRAAHARMTARVRAKGWGKRLSYGLQTALARPLVWLLSALPLDRASAFGGWFGRNVGVRLIDRGLHARTLGVAFPDMSETEREAILLGMSDNVGRVLGEMAHLPEFSGPGNPRLRLRGVERLQAARASGGPVLFIGGHFGNWELLTVAVRAAGFDGHLVVQHPNNPHVLEWIAAQRYRSGVSGQVAAEEGVYATLRREFKRGGAAIMLTDQRVLKGIVAPFFGLETITNLIPARLARDFGAAVVFLSNRRLGGARFEIEFHEPVLVERSPDRAADERAFTARMNGFFEDQIRAAPAFWLWGHPRFDDALGLVGNSSKGDESAGAAD